MYWSTVARKSNITHDAQRHQVQRYDGGSKSPYHSEADTVDQADRQPDGYNRHFFRVLRQIRGRYAPVIIQRRNRLM